MKKLKLFGSIIAVSSVALTLAACGSNQTSSQVPHFKTTVPKKAIKQGGKVSVALESDTPITGYFSEEFVESQPDVQAMQFGCESLFKTDKHYKYINGGAANIKVNKNAKTVTITINPKVKWSDGKPLVAKDIEYAYEMLGNKDSKSTLYTGSLQTLVGMKEYHDGSAKTISGIDMPDGDNGRKVVLHYLQMKPAMLQAGNGYIWESAASYHYLKDVPFKDLLSSDKIRKKPLFFGPYKVKNMVRGQSITWVPNEYYYKGKPKLDQITITVINPNTVTQAINSQKFDVADVINSQWKNVKNAKNTNFVAHIPLEYNYLGFKVGKWDAQKGENVMNPNAKMNNRALRQAIAYGLNVNQVYKRYTSGLTFRVPTLIPEQFGSYFDKNDKGYDFNIKKGNEILDKAGFKKKGTYRTLPDGKPLVINLAAKSKDSTTDPVIRNYIQQWKKMGLNVKLVGGRLMEFNSFYDKLAKDAPGIDMYFAGWSLSTEPTPDDEYGEKAPWNYSRFVTKENNKLLEQMNSLKAFDNKYRVQKFHEWQTYMNKEAYIVPVDNHYAIMAVNKKLTGYSLDPDKSDGNSFPDWYNVGYAK